MDHTPSPSAEEDRTISGATRPMEVLSIVEEQSDRPILMEMSGSHAGRIHGLQSGEFTIGRGRQCSLVFPDLTLSRVHAAIIRDGADCILEDRGSTNGTFVNHERVGRQVLSHGDFIRLGSGVRLQFQWVTVQEEQVLRRIYESSVLDGLTQVFNRRLLEERLLAELAYALRHHTNLGVLLFDLDHFKQVNDVHGHLAGDEVLRQVARLVGSIVRREDILARYGGEEFVLLVRGIPPNSVLTLAERLRASIASMSVLFEGTSLGVTVSIGVAFPESCPPPVTVPTLLARADEALYHAKQSGRNRVAVAAMGNGEPEVWRAPAE